MKQKTRSSIKRSISSVSTKNRNKRENTSNGNGSKIDLSKCDPNSKDFINYKYSPTNSSMTLSSISIAQNSMTSLQSNHTLTSSAHKYNTAATRSRQNSRQSSVISFDKTDSSSCNSQNKEPIYGTTRRNITKPSHAPPPPPVKLAKPDNPPPPLPISTGNDSFGSRFKFDPVDSAPLVSSPQKNKEVSRPNVKTESLKSVRNSEMGLKESTSSISILNSVQIMKPVFKAKLLGSSLSNQSGDVSPK